MMRRRLAVLAGLSLVAVTAFTAPSSAVVSGGSAAVLVGEEEVPGPGDPDGFGTAIITLDPDEGEVCYRLRVSGIATATAAHIHVGGVGVAGPVVITLAPPRTRSSGCVAADPDLVQDIIDNPEDFYVNVHNTPFPAGAVRGQLS